MTGVGALFGKTADGWRNDYLAERDAVLRHYISLHPEDFPLPSKNILWIIEYSSIFIVYCLLIPNLKNTDKYLTKPNFVPFLEREKFADVLLPWVPIR